MKELGADDVHNGNMINYYSFMYSFMYSFLNSTRIYSLDKQSRGHGPAVSALSGELVRNAESQAPPQPSEPESAF